MRGTPLYSKFGDLSPIELMKLFAAFSSWPEYDESVFRVAAKSLPLDDLVDDRDESDSQEEANEE